MNIHGPVFVGVALFLCGACAHDAPGEDRVGDEGQACEVVCTYTQGYWKNHAPWAVGSLALGSTTYSEGQLLSILGQSVGGNGLISLAHQLIAAKLNVPPGASAGAIGSAIASADAAIGNLVVPPVGNGYLPPAQTSALVAALTSFNEGLGEAPPCD